jgi:hypothetical protein
MEHELVYTWDMRSDKLCVITEYECIDLWPLMF